MPNETSSLVEARPAATTDVRPAPRSDGFLSVAGTTAHSTFWAAFWLAAALVATKAVHWGRPDLTLSSLLDYCQDLAISSHADVLFAFVVGFAAQVALIFASGRPRLARAMRITFIVFCTVCVVYAVVSVRIFAYLRSPLTYPLIYLAGDMKNMQSSVGAFVNKWIMLAVIAAPLSYLSLAWATHRFIQPKRTRVFRCGQVLGMILLVLYAVYGRRSLAGSWGDRDDHLIAENPHWVLVSSCVSELFGGTVHRLNEKFPPEDLADFQIVSERPASRAPIMDIESRPRNVIVLVMESTATQFMGLYGSPYETTPRLEAEAAHSLVFDNFYCHVGLTANAVVAIGLSVYPGMTWREYTVEHPRLRGTSLAGVLGSHGYRSAFVHNGDLGYANQRDFLRDRGFDVLWDYHDLGCGPPPPEFSWGVEDRCLIDGVLKFIDQDRDRPFCVLGWTIQAHHPYELQPAKQIDFFQGKIPPGADDYSLGLYLNVMAETDRQLGRLLDGLRERGLADDTLVLITGDHGEAFGFPHKTFGHGGKLFQENVNVPLIVWNPRLYNPGRRVQTIGSQVDINPTVLDLLGVPVPDSWQGRSLFDPARPPRAYFYAANDDYLLGVREDNWKYIFNAHRGREELFDLGHDPTEQANVAGEHPQTCQRLRQRLAAWMDYENRHLPRIHQAKP